VIAHRVDTILEGPANGKGKEKEEKKDLSRQTTLFGLPAKQPNEKKAKAKQTATTGGKASAGACESQTQAKLMDVDMAEASSILLPQSETATLVETQVVEQASLVETQPLDEDDEPIEWSESPQAPLVELDEQ